MTYSPQLCANCGATLSLQDLTRPNCPYCGQVLRHQARAAEHAALVNQVLGQQIGAQNPWLGAGGVPQIPYQYGATPQPGQQFAAHAAASAELNRAVARTSKVVVLVVLASVLGVLLLSVGIVLLLVLL
jgi:predicted RNA-binding Zn-ribbon protein involved in translation (DUF1610 family)